MVTFSKQAGHILHVLLVVFRNLLTFLTFLTFHLLPFCLSYPARGILCWLYWFLLWGYAGAKGTSFQYLEWKGKRRGKAKIAKKKGKTNKQTSKKNQNK
jgi:hypothetical protein